MKKANMIGVIAMTVVFLLCSCLGYAAFGDHTPGNIFAAFYEPFWLVALGDMCVVIHMIGAYQVRSLFFSSAIFRESFSSRTSRSRATNMYKITKIVKLRRRKWWLADQSYYLRMKFLVIFSIYIIFYPKIYQLHASNCYWRWSC